ncbi:MAG: endonuclease/exonuclease/phosphatase family protein [Clostridia bacterium]|nr:endonuclease/exonuclease/phosphatase family protein [Clostridia bacterium]
MKIKLMSYNTQHCLNYITRQIDFDIMADTIRKCGADIIGLQEMRNESEHPEYDNQAGILAEKLGFYYYFAEAIKFSGVNPYGNAIISRYPIKNAQTVMIPDPDPKTGDRYYETRCLLKAEIDVGDGLCVCVSHFGLNDDEQINAVDTVVKNLEDKTCVLMGDFNVTPESTVLNPIREIMFDTAEKFDGEKLSYPSDKPEIKIDYIFTSKDIKVLGADIPAIVSSDHCPHIADIEV